MILFKSSLINCHLGCLLTYSYMYGAAELILENKQKSPCNCVFSFPIHWQNTSLESSPRLPAMMPLTYRICFRARMQSTAGHGELWGWAFFRARRVESAAETYVFESMRWPGCYLMATDMGNGYLTKSYGVVRLVQVYFLVVVLSVIFHDVVLDYLRRLPKILRREKDAASSSLTAPF